MNLAELVTIDDLDAYLEEHRILHLQANLHPGKRAPRQIHVGRERSILVDSSNLTASPGGEVPA